MFSELFLPVLMVIFMLVVGGYAVAVLDRLVASALGTPQAGGIWLAPMARGAWLLTQHANATEALAAANERHEVLVALANKKRCKF